MFIIPSIDIEPKPSRSYTAAIAESVREWDRAGFGRVQLSLGTVDRPVPDERVLEDLLRDVQSSIQLAGQFGSTEEIDAALSSGAEFVVLGSRALDEPEWLAAVAGRFPGQLLLETPARERRSRSRGAVRTLPLDLRDVAAEISGLPMAGLLVRFSPEDFIGHAELALLEDIVDDVDFPVQVWTGSPHLGMLRDLEFRGVAATLIDAAQLAASFDGQSLARSFVD